jgi:hypothetical protein
MADSTTGIPAIDFSEAKSHLSDVMSQVVRDHQPRLVSRHRGKEAMLLLSADDVVEGLHQYRLEPDIVFSEGEATAQLSQFGLLGFGNTVDEALDDLLAELRTYSQRFFDRSSFYMQSDRREHWPWLLRFALTPPDDQRLLLVEPPSASTSR